MIRRPLSYGFAVILIALAALALIRVHKALGAAREIHAVTEGHRLAEAWCKTCHAIDMQTAGTANSAPDFAAIANQPSTTELALKVFLRSNHRNMPDLFLKPEQADNLASYILGLKRR